MDFVTMQDLKFLSTCDSDHCVSIFMPTHRTRPEKEQDPIRLKNLLRGAEERLEERGMSKRETDTILDAPRRLLDDFTFWEHQSDGLALFSSEEILRTYRVPLDFNELFIVSDSFHVKPLLPMLTDDGRFFLLALSQNEVRLMQGNRSAIEEIEFKGGLPTLADVLGISVIKKEGQFHTSTRPAPVRERSGVFYGHDPDDDEKKRVLNWLHVVDEEIADKIRGTNAPLVVACVDSLFPVFEEANSYHNLVTEIVSGNPEEMSVKDLHGGAWELVEPIFRKDRLEAFRRYNDLSATDKTTAETGEAVIGAIHGRVDTMFVDVGVEIWGQYNADELKVDIHQSREPGDTDLINLAAVHTLLNGGVVYPVGPDDEHSHTPIEAIFRY